MAAVGMSKIESPTTLLFLPGLAGQTGDGPTDARALTLQLFDTTSPGLRRYIRSFGLDSTAADDLTQDTFIALYRHLGLGRSRANLTGWLYTVAHHQALKHRARLARRARAEVSLAPEDCATPDRAATPEAQLVATRESARLRVAFDALPARDRQVLHLRAEGLAYRAIASALGMSLGSVAKSVARALGRLQTASEEAPDVQS